MHLFSFCSRACVHMEAEAPYHSIPLEELSLCLVLSPSIDFESIARPGAVDPLFPPVPFCSALLVPKLNKMDSGNDVWRLKRKAENTSTLMGTDG